MNTKEQILESLSRLSDDATIEDATEWLYVLREIEIGAQQIEAGQTVTNEEVLERLNPWLTNG